MTTQNLTVANTILEQLGGSRFTAMTGASGYVGDEDSLQFRVGRNPKGVTHVRIKLEADDTYTVRTMRVRRYEVKDLAFRTMVHAEDLRRVFESETELRTSL